MSCLDPLAPQNDRVIRSKDNRQTKLNKLNLLKCDLNVMFSIVIAVKLSRMRTVNPS